MRTCSMLSVLLVPVVAGKSMDAGVQVPTKGMTNGKNGEPLGAMIFRLRLLTRRALRESGVVSAVAAGSVQQSVADRGETPSQTKDWVRVMVEVVSWFSVIRSLAGKASWSRIKSAAACTLTRPQPYL